MTYFLITRAWPQWSASSIPPGLNYDRLTSLSDDRIVAELNEIARTWVASNREIIRESVKRRRPPSDEIKARRKKFLQRPEPLTGKSPVTRKSLGRVRKSGNLNDSSRGIARTAPLYAKVATLANWLPRGRSNFATFFGPQVYFFATDDQKLATTIVEQLDKQRDNADYEWDRNAGWAPPMEALLNPHYAVMTVVDPYEIKKLLVDIVSLEAGTLRVSQPEINRPLGVYAMQVAKSLSNAADAVQPREDSLDPPRSTRTEVTDATEDSTRFDVLNKLQPAHRKAYLTFLYAEAKAERRLEDRDAYDLLAEDGIAAESGELVDYSLPRLSNWLRYLGFARNATGEQKYTPRTKRKRSD